MCSLFYLIEHQKTYIAKGEKGMNTALRAEETTNITFISEAHEKFYEESLKRVRYQDVYHKALCYTFGIASVSEKGRMVSQSGRLRSTK